MPELPDIAAYLTALEPRIVGQPIERIRLASPFLLRTAQPPIASVEGHVVRELRRIGKRIAIGLEGDLWLVLHLMIAGRLHWRSPGAKLVGPAKAWQPLIFPRVRSCSPKPEPCIAHRCRSSRGSESAFHRSRRHRRLHQRSRLISRSAHRRKPHPQTRPH